MINNNNKVSNNKNKMSNNSKKIVLVQLLQKKLTETMSIYMHIYIRKQNININKKWNSEDCIYVLANLGENAIVSFEYSWTFPENFPAGLKAKLEIYGSKATAYLDRFDLGVQIYKEKDADLTFELTDFIHWPEINGKIEGDLKCEINHFCEAILKNEEFDLVFMDIQMPKIDGFETTRLIRKPGTGVLNPNIPVVALTAHAIKGYREKCLAAGMNDHLSKPFKIATLDKTIRKWLPDSDQFSSVPDLELNRRVPMDAFDAMKFERLREETGNEFGDLIRLYLEELPTKIGLITKAIESADMDELKNTVHRLKSNSAIFGASAMVSLCEELERSDTGSLVKTGDQLSLQLLKNSKEIQEILKRMI